MHLTPISRKSEVARRTRFRSLECECVECRAAHIDLPNVLQKMKYELQSIYLHLLKRNMNDGSLIRRPFESKILPVHLVRDTRYKLHLLVKTAYRRRVGSPTTKRINR